MSQRSSAQPQQNQILSAHISLELGSSLHCKSTVEVCRAFRFASNRRHRYLRPPYSSSLAAAVFRELFVDRRRYRFSTLGLFELSSSESLLSLLGTVYRQQSSRAPPPLSIPIWYTCRRRRQVRDKERRRRRPSQKSSVNRLLLFIGGATTWLRYLLRYLPT